MMKLKKAALYFNNTRCNDAYTGDFLFKGQLDVYTEGVRDGVTVQRRVLELAPGTVVPARRCVSFGGADWIVGADNFDIWKGELIREKYALHRAEGLAEVTSLEEALAGDVNLLAFAGRIWVRTIKEIAEDSEEFNLLNIYFARSEPIQPHQIVFVGGRYHIVKEVYPSTAGHLAAVSEMIDEPFKDRLAVDSVRLDPRTELPVPGDEYDALRLRWQSDFDYLSQMTENFQRGDNQVVVEVSANVAPGSFVTLSDGRWNVVATQIRNGVKYVHVRKLP